MMELSEFLNEVGKIENHWVDCHVIMGKIWSYEKNTKSKNSFHS